MFAEEDGSFTSNASGNNAVLASLLLAFGVGPAGRALALGAVEDVRGCGGIRLENTLELFALKAPVAFGGGGAAFAVNHHGCKNEKRKYISQRKAAFRVVAPVWGKHITKY